MFRDDSDSLRELGASPLAISTDDLERHVRFNERAGPFPFPLASDAGGAVARLYGVLAEEGGRARRAVFVDGADGRVVHREPWFQPGSVDQYLAVFAALSAGT